MDRYPEPILWFGEDFTNPLKKDRSSDFVMDSAMSYYGKDDPTLPYPTKTIPLDYPFKNGMSGNVMKNRWKKTARNIIFWQSSTNLHGKLVPALHAWNKEALRENLLWLQKYSDADYLAVGSIVEPDFTNYTGFFGDRQPNKRLVQRTN